MSSTREPCSSKQSISVYIAKTLTLETIFINPILLNGQITQWESLKICKTKFKRQRYNIFKNVFI